MANKRSLQSDEDLLARAVKGDAEAFGDLYERHLGAIYRYIYYRVGETRLAEDLTETTFLKAWQALPRFRIGGTPFRVWLYRVAHNLLVDHYRTRKEQVPLSVHPPMADPSPSPEEELIARDRRDWVSAAIARLSPDYQEVLTLRFVNGLSHSEAAEVLGRSVGAVRVLQHRALKALREVLVNRKGDPGA
jgi:RNA polymerase sigma-70 factor (ECF subfamily)